MHRFYDIQCLLSSQKYFQDSFLCPDFMLFNCQSNNYVILSYFFILLYCGIEYYLKLAPHFLY